MKARRFNPSDPGKKFLRTSGLFLCIFSSCGLIELPDTSGLRFFPGRENQILQPGQSIRVSFPFTPDRESAESIMTVGDFGGGLPGKHRWEGDTLHFIPEPSLSPGGRYLFSFSGVFRDRRGIEYEGRHRVPFFHLFRNDRAPFLVSASPLPGGILEADEEIRLRFSRNMDPVSFGENFSLIPRRAYDLAWENEDREAVIRPRAGWENLAVHTLSFGEGIRDRLGAAFSPHRNILYLVQDDTERPRVIEADAALNDPGRGFPSLGPLHSGILSPGDLIRIVFSEAMERDKTREAVRLAPRPGGSWFWLDDRVLLFLPETGYETGRSHIIEIGNSAEDLRGNRILPWGPLSFIPRASFLEPRVELAGDGIVLAGGDFSSAAPRTITLSPPFFQDYTFIADFTGGFFSGDREKLSAMEGFVLSCVFPPSAPSPVPSGWSWTGDRRFSVTFTGFIPGSPTREYYYLLTIKGGPGGIRAGDGAILRGDVSLLLKTEGPE